MKRFFFLHFLLTLLLFTAGASVASAATYTSTYTINGQNGVTIDGATFNNSSGTCLKIISSRNITIRNSTFTNCGMNGSKWSRAIVAYDSDNITIERNNFHHVAGGVYVQGAGRGKTYSNIKINYNRFWDFPLHVHWNSFVQIDTINGPGHQVNYNQGAKIPQPNTSCSDPTSFACFASDNFSVYQSGGTASSYFQFIGNYEKGAVRFRAASGGAFGDSGKGVQPGNYVFIKDNTAIDTAGAGFGIGGGQYHKIVNNLTFQSKRPEAWTGIASFNWRGEFPCSNHIISGNQVKATDAYGANNPFVGGCSNITGLDTNNWNANLNRCSKASGTIAWNLPVDFPECKGTVQTGPTPSPTPDQSPPPPVP
jgi:hypothetical protein